jgi:hypothetical protein
MSNRRSLPTSIYLVILWDPIHPMVSHGIPSLSVAKNRGTVGSRDVMRGGVIYWSLSADRLYDRECHPVSS